MKKLWILLVVLMVLAAMPSFSKEVTFAGDFRMFGNNDFADGGATAISRNRFWWDVAVDDYNKLYLQLHDRNGVTIVDETTSAGVTTQGTTDQYGVEVRVLRLTTNVAGALKLPFVLETQVGWIEYYMTGWSYYTAIYKTWAFVGQGFQKAIALKAGFGPATVHWWNDAEFEDFMAALNVSVAGVSGWLAYGAPFEDLGGGSFQVEAAYPFTFGDFGGAGSAFFKYGLGDSSFTWGVNLKGEYGMFRLAAGLEGDNTNALDQVVAELKISPLKQAQIYAALYLANGVDFGSVDLGGSYSLGAAKFSAGYVIGDKVNVIGSGDNYGAQGIYGGVTISY